MLSLQDREWAALEIIDYFEPKRGTEKNMAALGAGDTPLISARNVGNGVKSFVSVPSARKREGHAITLNNDGDGGAGLAYYQPMAFALDTHVTELRPKTALSREAMQFAAAAISKQHDIFGHGHSISSKRLGLLRAMLPVDASGKPDWQFMEDYIREREALQVKKCREFLTKRISDIERERERVKAARRPSLRSARKFGSLSRSPLLEISCLEETSTLKRGRTGGHPTLRQGARTTASASLSQTLMRRLIVATLP